MAARITVRRLGRTQYEPCVSRMRAAVALRIDQRESDRHASAGSSGSSGSSDSVGSAADVRPPSDDEIWLTEHEAVFTQGLAGRAEHLLDPGPIPVVATERGGQVTYHGPGQIVVYPMIDLQRMGIGVRELVQRIEQSVIDSLADFGISAMRCPGAPGVYVRAAAQASQAPQAPQAARAALAAMVSSPVAPFAAPVVSSMAGSASGADPAALGLQKIASIGLKIRRGISLHGVALNVDMDLSPFDRINPCGYAGLRMTDIGRQTRTRGDRPPTVQQAGEALLAALIRQLGA